MESLSLQTLLVWKKQRRHSCLACHRVVTWFWLPSGQTVQSLPLFLFSLSLSPCSPPVIICQVFVLVAGVAESSTAHPIRFQHTFTFVHPLPLSLPGGYPCPLSCGTINLAAISLLSRLRCLDQSRRQIVVMSERTHLHFNWPEDERHERKRETKTKRRRNAFVAGAALLLLFFFSSSSEFLCLIYATIQKVKIQHLNGCQKPKQVTNVWGVAVKENRLGDAL